MRVDMLSVALIVQASSYAVAAPAPEVPIMANHRARPVRPNGATKTELLGFLAKPEMTRKWGELSPWFINNEGNTPSKIPTDCKVEMVQVVSRHGARSPTWAQAKKLEALGKKLSTFAGNARNQVHLPKEWQFLKNWEYSLGQDNLTPFGIQEMVNSGKKFYDRYSTLAKSERDEGKEPFYRASGSSTGRIYISTQRFRDGYMEAMKLDRDPDSRWGVRPKSGPFNPFTVADISKDKEDVGDKADKQFSFADFLKIGGAGSLIDASSGFEKRDEKDGILVLGEGFWTLNKDNALRCQSKLSSAADWVKNHATGSSMIYPNTFLPGIVQRFARQVPRLRLDASDVYTMMALCAYETVNMETTVEGNANIPLSDFCNLFTLEDWENYDYSISVEKYEAFGPGNKLSAARGRGFVNELFARLEGRPMGANEASPNPDFDHDPAKFPIDRKIYIDVTHDNDILPLMTAMGLFEAEEYTPVLSNREKTKSAWKVSTLVPFAARMYVEKLRCGGSTGQPTVRVLVNDKVMDLGCGNKATGCPLPEWKAKVQRFLQANDPANKPKSPSTSPSLLRWRPWNNKSGDEDASGSASDFENSSDDESEVCILEKGSEREAEDW